MERNMEKKLKCSMKGKSENKFKKNKDKKILSDMY